MLKYLSPAQMVDSVYDIDLEELKKQGIRGIIADLDNTLVPWHSCEIPCALEDWFCKVRNAGFKIAVVSNNTPSRVEEFSSRLGVTCIAKAVKPRRGAFRRIAADFGFAPQEMAVVGDQLFTDILGGNRCGMYTILVTPISRDEFIGTKLMRLVERIFLRRLQKRQKRQ